MTQIINNTESPFWEHWLGVMTIIFGVLLVAMQGTEILRQSTLKPDSAAVQDVPPRCPEYDLEKDGLSVEYCHAMVAHLKGQILTTPKWFRSFEIKLSTVGLVFALLSIIAGIALIDNRAWATSACLAVFLGLTLVDGITFIAVYASGPLARSLYLWNDMLWLVIHMTMTAAILAGIHEEQARGALPNPDRDG